MNTAEIKPIVSTIWGVELQTCQLTGIPYPMRKFTTLNERFDIQANVAHNSTEYPRMRYLTIGNGGHRSKMGANGIEIGEVLQHTPTDAALFNHIPFVAREPNNDLTPQQREKFALRRVETHLGKKFVMYYAYDLNPTALNTRLLYRTVNANAAGETETVMTAYTPTLANLNPKPQPIEEVSVNTLDGQYVSVEAIIPFVMDKWLLDEVKNAANIIYGDERYAVISELAMVSGVKRVVTSSGTSGNFNHNEIICAQVCAFVNTDFRPYYHNAAVDLNINVGATEPMFKLVAP